MSTVKITGQNLLPEEMSGCSLWRIKRVPNIRVISRLLAIGVKVPGAKLVGPGAEQTFIPEATDAALEDLRRTQEDGGE